MPPCPCLFRGAASDRASRDLLIGFAIPQEDLANFEQREIAITPVGIALRRRNKARQEAWPHIGKLGGNRIGERQGLSPAAKQHRPVPRDKGPCHRLDKSVGRKRPLGSARAL